MMNFLMEMSTNKTDILEKSNLPKIRELTEKLPSLVDLIRQENKKVTEYKMEENSGDFFGIGLYKTKEVAVQRVFMSKGSFVPLHAHPEAEVGIVYKGKIRVFEHNDRPEKICLPGDIMYFKQNEAHRGELLEDTWMIFITVPAGEGYPDV